ncbi:DUF397 domain-containing protein [Actinomadura sp. 6K520]|jgi:hypothetical protein|uniref:DUF397 domain-containing protein n=1 Tax=Actinomadura sp. 6K520 TaxID=2530364 RepID=UPI0032606BE8
MAVSESETHETLTSHERTKVAWHISNYSPNNGGNCVEAGPVLDGTGRVAVRRSQRPDAEVILYTRPEWESFLARRPQQRIRLLRKIGTATPCPEERNETIFPHTIPSLLWPFTRKSVSPLFIRVDWRLPGGARFHPASPIYAGGSIQASSDYQRGPKDRACRSISRIQHLNPPERNERRQRP